MRRTHLKTHPLYHIIHDRKSASPLPQSSCRLVSIWKEVIRKEMAGPSSGIQIDDDVVQEFNEIIKGHRDKYCLLKISSDQKHVQVDEIGAKEKTYEDCRQKLIAGGPRYAIVDFDLEESRQGVGVAKTSKVVLMKWTPDGCPVRERMLYTSTFNTLKAKLGGALVHCECHDESELDESNIEARCRKSK